jgi:hypothetical protein
MKKAITNMNMNMKIMKTMKKARIRCIMRYLSFWWAIKDDGWQCPHRTGVGVGVDSDMYAATEVGFL